MASLALTSVRPRAGQGMRRGGGGTLPAARGMRRGRRRRGRGGRRREPWLPAVRRSRARHSACGSLPHWSGGAGAPWAVAAGEGESRWAVWSVAYGLAGDVA